MRYSLNCHLKGYWVSKLRRGSKNRLGEFALLLGPVWPIYNIALTVNSQVFFVELGFCLWPWCQIYYITRLLCWSRPFKHITLTLLEHISTLQVRVKYLILKLLRYLLGGTEPASHFYSTTERVYGTRGLKNMQLG